MVSEPDTRQCASEEVEPQRKVDTRRCASKDVGPPKGGGSGLGGSYIDWRRERASAKTLGSERGWIEISHIGWGGEQNILFKGSETSL